jgi:hypothetical protein
MPTQTALQQNKKIASAITAVTISGHLGSFSMLVLVNLVQVHDLADIP